MAFSPGAVFGRIERRRAVDEIYEAIREAIADRRLPPGSRLNLQELACQFGVSATPVRVAIQNLSAQRMVEVHSRKGTFVARLTHRDLAETFDVLCALKGLAAEEAAQHLTDEQVRYVRRLAASGGNTSRDEVDAAIQEIIFSAARSPRLIRLCNDLQARIAMGWARSVQAATQPGAPYDVILAAMERRDAKALSQAARSECRKKKEAVLASLKRVQ
jgi:DNA-binding GntR family transcriptional regulator